MASEVVHWFDLWARPWVLSLTIALVFLPSQSQTHPEMNSRSLPTPLFAFAGVLVTTAFVAAAPVADFSLSDVNVSSPRYESTISPRDYLHQVSIYYFGSST